jgi:Xaa-Pro dipeptidase
MHSNPFTDAELARRVAATREQMAARDLDMILLSSPENIFYLVGLDHWGYFAPTVLIVPSEGELVLITREMERVVIRNQVRNAVFVGHTDSENAADTVTAALKGKTAGKSIGLE